MSCLADKWRGFLTKVCAFLAGVSFVSVFLVYLFKDALLSSSILYLTVSLDLSVVFFSFSALLGLIDSKKATVQNLHLLVYFAGFASLFVSLYLTLSYINQIVAAVSVVLVVVLFVSYLLVAFRE